VPLLDTESLSAGRLPLVLFPDGTQLEGPEEYTGRGPHELHDTSTGISAIGS
jgi:hypothetical protein